MPRFSIRTQTASHRAGDETPPGQHPPESPGEAPPKDIPVDEQLLQRAEHETMLANGDRVEAPALASRLAKDGARKAATALRKLYRELDAAHDTALDGLAELVGLVRQELPTEKTTGSRVGGAMTPKRQDTIRAMERAVRRQRELRAASARMAAGRKA